MRIFHIAFHLILVQGLLGQSLRPALSLTYFRDNAVPDPLVQHHTYSLNANLIYELTPSNNLGLQYIFIKTKGSSFKYSEQITDYYIAGIFFQHDFMPNENREFFPEVSFNYGNYCPCGNTDPYQKDGLIYFGYGAGADLQIYKNLYLDLGLHYYRPVLRLPDEGRIWAFSQYILGLSYKLL